ncbi:MAG: hypothetical protein WDA65_08305 [Christensenellales bacterium]
MKRLIIVLDGIADRPQPKLLGKTPMEAAKTAALDGLCQNGRKGTVRTIPAGMEVGSAVANLGLLGYDAKTSYKGRAVIEAAGAGISIKPDALYIRCNFVALEGRGFERSVMRSYNAHDIETDEAKPLTRRLNETVFNNGAKLAHIDTFRNILIVEKAARIAPRLTFAPAHEIIGRKVADYLRGTDAMRPYFEMMQKAYDALARDNNTAANGIWFWGASRAPEIPRRPAGNRVVLAETSLMCGIAALFKIDCVKIPEDNGFEAFLKAKAKAALEALEKYDSAYIHIQKLDDLSHELEPEKKMRAIEMIDEHFIHPFFKRLARPYSAVIVSDHYTFSDSGGHGGEPAPFLLLGHGSDNLGGRFTERHCRETNFGIDAAALNAIQRGEE